MSLDKKAAARLLGMKPEEVRAVVELGGGVYEVTTHDGTITTVDGDKLTTRQGDTTVALVGEAGPELVDAGGRDGQQAVVAEAMALPVDERAEVKVVDEALFLAAEPEDLAELGLARLGGSPVAQPQVEGDEQGGHPIVDGDRNQREAEAGFRGDDGLAKAIAGNAAGVLAWVGDDPDRARRAIEAEKARTSSPRVTLLHALEQIAKAEQG
jgi:hypothetical protein